MDKFIERYVRGLNVENPLQYVRDAIKPYALEKLNLMIENCNKCEICTGCKSVPVGNPNASVLIIGSNPVNIDLPLSSAIVDDQTAFNVLEQVFDMLKVNADDIMFSNIVNCKPFKEMGGQIVDRIPLRNEINNCNGYLNQLIEIVQPLVIIVLGSVALKAINPELNLTANEGQWFEFKGIPTIATQHPNYFKQMQDKKDEELLAEEQYEFIGHLQSAFEYIQNTYPEVNILLED